MAGAKFFPWTNSSIQTEEIKQNYQSSTGSSKDAPRFASYRKFFSVPFFAWTLLEQMISSCTDGTTLYLYSFGHVDLMFFCLQYACRASVHSYCTPWCTARHGRTNKSPMATNRKIHRRKAAIGGSTKILLIIATDFCRNEQPVTACF